MSALLRGAVAAGLVGLAGDWHGPVVAILALASGLSFFDLGRRDRVERTISAAREHDVYGVAMQVAFLAVLCAAAWDNRLPAPAGHPDGVLTVLGVAVLGAGLCLRQGAARALGRHFTVTLSLLDDHELVAIGPYRWLRHPNFAGLLLIALGTAMMVRSPMAVVVTLGVWLPLVILRIRQEERVLRVRLGERYAEYARRRWCLLPGVY